MIAKELRMRGQTRAAGFTLVEALVATLLMAMILSALATVTAQWLPNWNRGFARVQGIGIAAIAVERLVADISAAEFVPPNRKTDSPLFEGTEQSIVFVRSSIGPNIRAGLDVVQISESADGQGPVLVRSRAPFAPGSGSVDQYLFANPVVLLRAPYRLTFSYAGKDGLWKSSWHDASILPSTVRLTISDSATGRALPISTVALVRAELPAECASGSECDDSEAKQNSELQTQADGDRSVMQSK